MIYYLNNDYRNYLYHHGIKGQKWGVRRFQNKDGTLTSMGRQRLSEYTKSASNKIAEKRIKRQEKRRADILRNPRKLKKNLDKYSDKEIKDALNRFNTLQQLETAARNDINKPKKAVDTVVGYGKTVVAAYGTYKALDKIIKNL